MGNYIYKNKKELQGVQDFLEDVNKILEDKTIDGTSVNSYHFSSEAMKKILFGISATTIVGASASSIVGVGAGLGVKYATSSAVVAAGAAASSIAVPALVVALPVVGFVGIIIGKIFSHSKNEKEKDLLREELTLYKDAIKKQNKIIRELENIKNRIIQEKDHDIEKLKMRSELLLKINEQLIESITNLEADLKVGKVLKK